MKKQITALGCALLFCCIFLPDLLADASAVTRVQTFTFDSLYTRRGTWKFPDAGKKYRKIIMNYTLKCDSRTARDKYNCGEWDYLTYNVVYHKTGRDTSYAKTASRYKLGASSADTLYFGTTPATFTTAKKITNYTIKSASGETPYSLYAAINTVPAAIVTGKTPFRVQYFLSNSELKTLGLDKKTVGRVKLEFANAAGATLKNLKIKMLVKGGSSLSYWADGMTEVFSGDVAVAGNDAVIDLNQDFQLKAINGLIIEISADGFNNDAAQLLGFGGMTNAFENSVFTSGIQKYMKFDGINDYIYTDSTGFLSNTSQMTYEADIRVDKWKSWSKLLGVGDQLHFETGDATGDLYFMVRNGMNSYAKAAGVLALGTWTHVAAVFDGSKSSNAEKAIIYINGKKTDMSYAGSLPATSAAALKKFMISSLEWNNAPSNESIRDVRVWNKALTADEIAAWYARPVTSEHPEYASLVLNYTFDNVNNFTVNDAGKYGNNAEMFGLPQLKTIAGEEMNSIGAANTVPAITLYSGTYTRDSSSSTVNSTEEADAMSLAEYEISGHSPVIKNIKKVWKTGYYYSYNSDGTVADSTYYNGGTVLPNEKLNYTTAPTAVLDTIEIGRFITPYGINLDLGPNGFTWHYDVTDYAQYLTGDVDFAAGNQQELLDVSFDFYDGEPAREVLRMTQPWGGYASYYYKDMASDKVLSLATVEKLPETKQIMMKTRLTGHGQQQTSGQYAHCCEWFDNTHYLRTTEKERSWHVFQEENNCALNPVFPQGGTWPYSREGWCPGDVVKDHDFEINEYKSESEMQFEYDITPVPENNQGMGNGNYIVALQLFEYGAATHSLDAEVYDIIAPSDNPLYSRMNPICAPPKVVIRNNGVDNLTSLHFDYNVKDGKIYSYDWTGSLEPNIKDTVELPIDLAFWEAATSKVFNVKISNPNGAADEYAVNDTMSATFNVPDIHAVNSILVFHAPSGSDFAKYFHLTVKDFNGNIIVNHNSISASSWYRDTLKLADGCYTMELTNDANEGISFWYNTGMGAGSIAIYSPDGKVAKAFNPDFGHSIVYSFSIGALTKVEDQQVDNLLRVYPNPAEKEVTLRLESDFGAAKAELFDLGGKLISTFDVSGMSEAKFNVENLPSGSYFVRVTAQNYVMYKNFIKK